MKNNTSDMTSIMGHQIYYTLLYGTVLYMLSHIVISILQSNVCIFIRNYFWGLVFLDVITLIYNEYIKISSRSGGDIVITGNPNIEDDLLNEKSRNEKEQEEEKKVSINLERNQKYSTSLEQLQSQANLINDNESIVGSDVGSLLDISDFEKTL